MPGRLDQGGRLMCATRQIPNKTWALSLRNCLDMPQEPLDTTSPSMTVFEKTPHSVCRAIYQHYFSFTASSSDAHRSGGWLGRGLQLRMAYRHCRHLNFFVTVDGLDGASAHKPDNQVLMKATALCQMPVRVLYSSIS